MSLSLTHEEGITSASDIQKMGAFACSADSVKCLPLATKSVPYSQDINVVMAHVVAPIRKKYDTIGLLRTFPVFKTK